MAEGSGSGMGPEPLNAIDTPVVTRSTPAVKIRKGSHGRIQ